MIAPKEGTMKIKRGSVGHLAVLSGLSLLTGNDGREVESAFQDLSAEKAQRLSEDLIKSKVMPVVARATLRRRENLPEGVVRPMEWTTRAANLVLDLYERELAEIAQRLRLRSAQVIMLKGIDLARNVWPGIPRVMADLDLMVQPAQLGDGQAVLEELGYVQGYFDRWRGVMTPFDLVNHKAENPYEVPIYRRLVRMPELDDLSEFLETHWGNNFYRIGQTCYLGLEIDLHHNVFVEFSGATLWEHPRRVAYAGEDVYALSPENLLLVLALRCYLESVTIKFNAHPIHLFLDTMAVLTKFAAELDFDDLERRARQHNRLPPIYYVLRHANDLLGGNRIPASYLKRWHPRRGGNDRAWDYGDFVPRLFDRVGYLPIELA
jgi:Uncharacterised nucleotidyltransferase